MPSAKRALLLFSSVFVGAPALAANPSAFPEYVQRVEAEFATESDAAAAEASFSPLPNGARYAFFCRWDDNRAANVRKAEMMDAVGVKGTFFLIGGKSAYLQDTGRRLVALGNAIGNHSLSHPSNMDTLPPNEVFRQILLGRIGVETNTWWTVTAFAMPWTRWCMGDPKRHGLFTRLLANTGHLWNDGHDAAHFSANDTAPDPGKFRAGFAEATARAEESGGTISADFGTHADCDEAGDTVQGRCIAENLSVGGAWRTHANAFAAYRYSSRNGRIAVAGRDGCTVAFDVVRFPPAFLGDQVPVELVFSRQPQTVRCKTADVRPVGKGGCWTLPHNRGLGMPHTIQGVTPGWLGFDVDEAAGTVRIALPSCAATWRDVCAVIMVPPMWRRGRIVAFDGGTFQLGDRSEDPVDFEGIRIYAVSVDYMDEACVPRRVWSVLERRGETPPFVSAEQGRENRHNAAMVRGLSALVAATALDSSGLADASRILVWHLTDLHDVGFRWGSDIVKSSYWRQTGISDWRLRGRPPGGPLTRPEGRSPAASHVVGPSLDATMNRDTIGGA
jgi:hypothetical protein